MSAVNTFKSSQNPTYCLFVPWTREKFAAQMLQNINDLMLPRSEMEVVFYVDTDDKQLWKRLTDWCMLNQFVYNGVKLVKSGNPQPLDYEGTVASMSRTIERRGRIVKMKEDSKQYIEATGWVFGIEDDTKVPVLAFKHLFEPFTQRSDIGFTMGVQQGRWGLTVLGAWRVDNPENPTVMATVPFEHETEQVEIDGGGFFCYITPVELYKDHKYHWYDECFGPDSTYGIELRKKGYTNLMDFRVTCDHMTDQGVLIPTPQSTLQVEWRKVGDRWIRQQD